MNITEDIVTSYLSGFYRAKSPELAELRERAEADHVPIILRSTENMLSMLLKLTTPGRILEIGAAVGYSSCFFAKASGADIVTLEADEHTATVAVRNIRSMGYSDRIRVITGDARETLSEFSHVYPEEKPFDMVFIDAAKSHYREFWDLSLPLINDGGVIVCDNVLMKGMTASDEFDTKKRYRTSTRRMRDFLDYIKDLSYADTEIFAVGDGLSISLINKEKYSEIIQDG